MSVKKTYKSPEHTFTILGSLYESHAHSDVTLVAGANQKRIHAHRGILAAGSEYFSAMFSGSFRESQSPEVIMKSIDGEILEALIKFLYSGMIEIREEIVLDLLKSANLFKISAVEQFCWQFLLDTLEPSNCLEIRSLSQQMGSLVTTIKVESFIKTKFNDVKALEDFLKLDLATFSQFISADDLIINREEEVVDAVMSWIKFNNEGRKKDFPQLLKYIRLPLLKPETILEVLEPNCTNPFSLEYINEGFKWHCMPTQRPLFSDQNSRQRRLIGGKVLGVNCIDDYVAINAFCPRYSIWSKNLSKFKSLPNVGQPKGMWKDNVVFVNDEGFVRFFQMTNKRWESLKSIPGVKKDFSTAILNGSLYITGGPQSRVVVRFDFQSRKLFTMQPLNCCRSLSASVALKGLVYVIGGRKEIDVTPAGQTETDDEEEAYDYVYDDGDDEAPPEEPAPPPPPPPAARPPAPPPALPLPERQYLDIVPAEEGLSSVESFDFRRNKWTIKSSLNNKRIQPIAVVSNGSIYVFGGRNNGQEIVRSIEKYDPEKDSWEEIFEITDQDLGAIQVTALDNRIYLLKRFKCKTTFEEFLPEKKEFKVLTEFDKEIGIPIDNLTLLVETN